MTRLAILALAVALALGCRTAPVVPVDSGPLLRGAGEAPILLPPRPEPPPPAPRELPWAGEVLAAEASRDVPPGADWTPGAALAAARLGARDDARADLARQAAALPATPDQDLAAFAVGRDVLRGLLESAPTRASELFRVERFGDGPGRVVVSLALPVEDLAAATLAAGGGLPGAEPPPPSAPEWDPAAAEQAARDLALEAARGELLEQLRALPLGGSVTVDDAMAARPVVARLVSAAVAGARAIADGPAAGGRTWRAELELDAGPVVAEVRRLHSAPPESP